MTTQFYSRYIPSTTTVSSVDQKSILAERIHKRKRTGSKHTADDIGGDGEKKKRKSDAAKASADGDITQAKGDKKEKRKKRKEKKDTAVDESTSAKTKKKDKTTSEHKDTILVPDNTNSGRSNILEKLRRSLNRAAERASPPAAVVPEIEASVVSKGLEPLPQPEPSKPSRPVSTLQTLPLWLSKPILIPPTFTTSFSSIHGLSPKLHQKLTSQSLTDAFAVQAAVLPLLLDVTGGDVCIAAATGSGKTLSYVLPVIQSLSPRVVTRLRAIIVVPTRELVSQVHSVANSLSAGTGLKIGTAVGSRPFGGEQEMLVFNEDGTLWSKVDILITTPGRLVDHVRSTPGFSLKWVRWLVIDEADRLLAQSFQEWVDVVIGGLEKAAAGKPRVIAGVDVGNFGTRRKHGGEGLRKVVLSATMTRDVGKLSGLKLKQPKLIVVEDSKNVLTAGGIEDANDGEQFSVPISLYEHAIPVDNIEYKPLYLLYLLRMNNIKTGVLIFAKSNEAAARLAKLVETIAGNSWKVGLVSGEMEKKRREKVLRRFSKGDINLLICSDLISRGVDLPNVAHIVNYDIPASVKAYIHRVGRTARAGKKGDAWTLIGANEARWFWNGIGKEIKRTSAIERTAVDMEAEGQGLRAVYEGVLYGKGLLDE